MSRLLAVALLAAPLAAQPVISVPVREEWPLALAESLYREADAPLPSPLWPEDWVLAAYVNDMSEPSCPGRFDANGLKGKPEAVVQKGAVVHFLPCSVSGRVFRSATYGFPLAASAGLSCRGVDEGALICRVEMESRPAGAAGPATRSIHYFGFGRRLGPK